MVFKSGRMFTIKPAVLAHPQAASNSRERSTRSSYNKWTLFQTCFVLQQEIEGMMGNGGHIFFVKASFNL